MTECGTLRVQDPDVHRLHGTTLLVDDAAASDPVPKCTSAGCTTQLRTKMLSYIEVSFECQENGWQGRSFGNTRGAGVTESGWLERTCTQAVIPGLKPGLLALTNAEQGSAHTGAHKVQGESLHSASWLSEEWVFEMGIAHTATCDYLT